MLSERSSRKAARRRCHYGRSAGLQARRASLKYPPLSAYWRGACFNLEAVKAEIEERVKAMKGKME
jgi:hypothetical protein